MLTRRLAALTAAVLLAAVVLAADAGAQSDPDPAAGGFILDYDVPESPAFVALGVAPNDVLTASAAKPVAAHILNQLLVGGQATPGVAFDVVPYFLYSGRFESISEYRESTVKRLLANLGVSAATIEAADVRSDLRYGVGARLTLFDSHDLLRDGALAEGLDAALADLADARSVDREADDEVEIVDLSERGGDLTALYAAARERVRTTPGAALAIGIGLSGRLKGRVMTADSAVDERPRLWAAYRYSVGNGTDFMATVQRVQGLGGEDATTLAGVALRTTSQDVRFSGEVVFNSFSGKLEPAVSADIRALPGIHLTAALQSEAADTGEQVLRLRTQIAWAMTETR